MSDRFLDVWRAVSLHVPLAPAMLARYWCTEVYRRACHEKGWSFLRAEGEIFVSNQRSGTVTVTRLSAIVQGIGLVFVTADIGRQFRIGPNSGPPYTILSVDLLLNTCTLDQLYRSNTAASTTGVILDAYATMPEDFGRFLAVLDPSNGYRMNFLITDDELNAWDAQRSSTGTAWALAPQGVSATGRIRYEIWPYPTAQRSFPFYYIKEPPTLTDDEFFSGPFRVRSDIILTGALAEAAAWPGTEDRKNPYFNLQLAMAKQAQYKEELVKLECRDEEIFMTWLETRPMYQGGFPGDARFLQSHDSNMFVSYR